MNTTTSTGLGGTKDVKCRMLIGGQDVVFQVDTGSSVNTLPVEFAKHIERTDKILSTWNKTRQVPLGLVDAI